MTVAHELTTLTQAALFYGAICLVLGCITLWRLFKGRQ